MTSISRDPKKIKYFAEIVNGVNKMYECISSSGFRKVEDFALEFPAKKINKLIKVNSALRFVQNDCETNFRGVTIAYYTQIKSSSPTIRDLIYFYESEILDANDKELPQSLK